MPSPSLDINIPASAIRKNQAGMNPDTSEAELGDPRQNIYESRFWVGWYVFRKGTFIAKKDASGKIDYTLEILLIDKLSYKDPSTGKSPYSFFVGDEREYISGRWVIFGTFDCCK